MHVIALTVLTMYNVYAEEFLLPLALLQHSDEERGVLTEKPMLDLEKIEKYFDQMSSYSIGWRPAGFFSFQSDLSLVDDSLVKNTAEEERDSLEKDAVSQLTDRRKKPKKEKESPTSVGKKRQKDHVLESDLRPYLPVFLTGKPIFSETELSQLEKLQSCVHDIQNFKKKEQARNRLVKAMTYCYMSQTIKDGHNHYFLRDSFKGSMKYLKKEYVINSSQLLESYHEGYEEGFSIMLEYCYALVNRVKFPLTQEEKKYCESNFKYY